jgi:hypothetical protein
MFKETRLSAFWLGNCPYLSQRGLVCITAPPRSSATATNLFPTYDNVPWLFLAIHVPFTHLQVSYHVLPLFHLHPLIYDQPPPCSPPLSQSYIPSKISSTSADAPTSPLPGISLSCKQSNVSFSLASLSFAITSTVIIIGVVVGDGAVGKARRFRLPYPPGPDYLSMPTTDMFTYFLYH